MTEYDRHVEIKTLLTEIRDRLPEPEATKDENTRFTDDLGTMTVSEDCGGDLNFRIHGNSGFASLNPHEVIRLLKVMQERADSYPNTLDRDDLPGEPVEPGDLRAGDRVSFMWDGERITRTLVSALRGAVLRSDAPYSVGFYPSIVFRGQWWCGGISDVRLIERAAREHIESERDVRREVEQEAAEGRVDALEALAVEQQRRAEKAELDRDSATARAESWHRQFEKEKARAEEAEARYKALRVDVDGLQRNPETLTRLLMRIADALDADDARTPTEGEKR